MIGQIISHYKILDKLGEGGMGVVYKAHDTKLDRFVALKFLPSHLSESEPEKIRFLQEAKAAAILNHPNVATIYEIGEAGDNIFIAMENVEGTTLRKKIQEEPLTIDQTVDIGIQIAGGLKAAHQKNIIHRDIKSENIMITPDGRAKIMDFGLAKIKGGLDITKSGSTVGTIGYMSPEQIQGAEVDERTDLWSLGVVLYEMIAGQRPFRAEHEAAIMYEILNVEPQAIQSARADVPEHLQIVVSRLLQKDASRRIPTAAEVIVGLKRTGVTAPSSAAEKSVAVLYFENMSSEKESDYFCAGITEDIITDLSKIKELKVVSRSDVLPFRSKEINTRQVGETLRVNYILEGSVRKSGNKIRITAQLIDVKTGFHVWAERYDRLIEDIFELQDDIAQSIAKALRISLSESEKQSLGKKPTDDIRAYDFYMRGREFLYKRGRKNNEAAIQMFENARSLDSNFAAVYAALAEAYSYMYSWYDGAPTWLEKTITISEKALNLDPDSIEAQFSIGTVYFHQKRLDEAKRTWEKVIQQNPDYYDAFRWLGIVSDISADYDAALRCYEECARIKPYSEEPWMHIEMTYRRMGNNDASDRAKRKLIDLGARKIEVNPDDAVTLSRMSGALAHFGEKEKAYAVLKKIMEMDPTDGLVQYNSACTYAAMGDKKESLACLRNAIQSGYKNVGNWVKIDPDFTSFHDDPEFKTLLAEIG